MTRSRAGWSGRARSSAMRWLIRRVVGVDHERQHRPVADLRHVLGHVREGVTQPEVGLELVRRCDVDLGVDEPAYEVLRELGRSSVLLRRYAALLEVVVPLPPPGPARHRRPAVHTEHRHVVVEELLVLVVAKDDDDVGRDAVHEVVEQGLGPLAGLVALLQPLGRNRRLHLGRRLREHILVVRPAPVASGEKFPCARRRKGRRPMGSCESEDDLCHLGTLLGGMAAAQRGPSRVRAADS